MNTSIHPYKGYLNTKFRVFVKGEKPLHYQVYVADKKKKQSILDGLVEPNQPCNITMPMAGEFIIEFEDGSTHNFRVEDGYRYGGNKLKNAFIFDNCPWAFVVMHDRTYFYNRQTQQSFVEPISPDDIGEIAQDYVVFKSAEHNELTLFSLEQQEPILWVDNISFYTKNVICWEDNNDADNDNNSVLNLALYSLSERCIIMQISCDKYSFDKKNNSLLYHTSAQIHRIDLNTFDDIIVHQYKETQKFMTFVNTHYAVSYASSQSKLYVLDAIKAEARGEILVQGHLAKVNDISIINVNRKSLDFRNFDLESFNIPEASIQAQYAEINIHPCDWEIDETFGCKFKTLYAEKLTTLQVSRGKFHNNFSQTEESCIKSIESDFSQSIDDINGTYVANENYFLFFNRSESLVIPRLYPSSTSYYKGKQVIQAGGSVAIISDDEVRFLTNRGFWDGKLEGNYDTSYLDTFGLLKNKENNFYYNLAGTEFGKFKCCIHLSYECLKVGDYIFYRGGEYITSSNSPQYLSPLGRMGLTITEKEVTLFEVRNHKVRKRSLILQDIYETQNYANVLLGEDGRQIIFRDIKQTKMLDLANGESFEFDNLSYINHVNGIRPFFRLSETSQALLINPVDGQPVNFNLVSEYQFVSPDYQLYADKTLDKYIEYYNLITQELISRKEFVQYARDFNSSSDDVTQKRLDFIHLHFDFLYNQLKKRDQAYENKSREEIIKVLSTKRFPSNWFTSLFVDIKGVAVIKRISDDGEVARIPLGPPLWFLNYVSFSKDSKYIAIAGRYPDESNYCGLFLVYDLEEKKTIIDSRCSYAVWTTAFTIDDVVAAYTSTPNSFVGPVTDNEFKNDNNEVMRDKGFNVRDLSFLTFSPDGKYFACSHQGYLCYRKPDGTIRTNWGHQPSSLVSIRNSANPQSELLALHDLSDEGIADTNIKQSVASVSFSNDNSRIMMVGRNGVVVVRNIDLNHYANK